VKRHLDHTKSKNIFGSVKISGSKSESNRLLILQELYPSITVENLSDSDDTQHLKQALQTTDTNTINIGHAGTAMRFLTAFFAIKKGKTTLLTGSKRMQNRPVKLLVEALKQLGGKIEYLKKEGFPPLQITGQELTTNRVKIAGNISSQYSSALLLIAASLPKGLVLELTGEITSVPYIKMTLDILGKIGVDTKWKANKITILPLKNTPKTVLSIEPDWSSASYFYSLAALKPNSKITLIGFKKDSLQGDHALVEIYKNFGVETTFNNKGITLDNKRNFSHKLKPLALNLTDTPDLAQTIAVTCFGLGLSCHLTGLHTLKIKETDRLKALKNELEKLGAEVNITNTSLSLISPFKINQNKSIKTYQDHRMAMAFAPLSTIVPIDIEEAEVVSKSYPNFWHDFESLL